MPNGGLYRTDELGRENETIARLTRERDRLRALLREVIAHIEEETSPDPSYVTLCDRLNAALEGRDG